MGPSSSGAQKGFLGTCFCSSQRGSLGLNMGQLKRKEEQLPRGHPLGTFLGWRLLLTPVVVDKGGWRGFSTPFFPNKQVRETPPPLLHSMGAAATTPCGPWAVGRWRWTVMDSKDLGSRETCWHHPKHVDNECQTSGLESRCWASALAGELGFSSQNSQIGN